MLIVHHGKMARESDPERSLSEGVEAVVSKRCRVIATHTLDGTVYK